MHKLHVVVIIGLHAATIIPTQHILVCLLIAIVVAIGIQPIERVADMFVVDMLQDITMEEHGIQHQEVMATNNT